MDNTTYKGRRRNNRFNTFMEDFGEDIKKVRHRGAPPEYLFKKGVSGNPNGRPKGKTIKERIREYLDKHPKDMESFFMHFINNNKELTWRMLEGNPPQPIEVAGKDGLPFMIKVVRDNPLIDRPDEIKELPKGNIGENS